MSYSNKLSVVCNDSSSVPEPDLILIVRHTERFNPIEVSHRVNPLRFLIQNFEPSTESFLNLIEEINR
jgi:hypothetical protein